MSDEGFDQVPLISVREVFIADAIVDVPGEFLEGCLDGEFCLS